MTPQILTIMDKRNIFQSTIDDNMEILEPNNFLHKLESKVKHALVKSKNGKAPEPVSLKLLKAIKGQNLNNLIMILNKIYQEGTVPKKGLKSSFIPIL